MSKDKIVEAITELPEEASIDDAIERLIFLKKIEIGLHQADTGQTMSTDEAKKKLQKWLK